MTPPPLRRRAETPADAPFRLALFVESRPPHERLSELPAALAAQLMRQQLAGQDATYRAAYPAARREIVEAAGAAVGRIVVDAGASGWTLVDIALLAAWRGRGLGTCLLRAEMDGATAAGQPLRLRVARANVEAARLYARLGFVETGAAALHVDMVYDNGANA